MVGDLHGNISFADGLAAAAMGRSLPGHNCQAAAEYAPLPLPPPVPVTVVTGFFPFWSTG